MSLETSTAIPLTNLAPQQPANDPAYPVVNDEASSTLHSQSSPRQAISVQTPSSSSITTNLSGSNNDLSLRLPTHVIRPCSWRERFENACSVANGIGTFALTAAVIFGIGAWVGMKIQINQGAKSVELAIWTACADHEVSSAGYDCWDYLRLIVDF